MEELHAARRLNSTGVMHKAGSLVINIVITLMSAGDKINREFPLRLAHTEIGGVECFILLKEEEARVSERIV